MTCSIYMKFVLLNIIVILQIIFAENQPNAKQQIESYTDCQLDADCKDHSFCFGNDDDKLGKCKCQSGYELSRNTTFYECIKGAKVGEPCRTDLQCFLASGDTSQCLNGKCECRPDSYSLNQYCYLKIKLGEVCTVDQNCYVDDGTENGTHVGCTYGRCTCPSNKRPSSDNLKCINNKQLGESCISDEECTFEGGTCATVCDCALKYTLARDEKSCIKAAENFGDVCSDDAQCSKLLPGSVCNSGRCGCNSDYHTYGSRCVLTRKVGQICTEDAECRHNQSLESILKCENKICNCVFGKRDDGNCKASVDDSNSANKVAYFILNTAFLSTVIRFLV